MRIVLPLSALLLFSLFGYSQRTGTVVKGVVLAADRLPAASINVYLKSSRRFAITDSKGNFLINHVRGVQDTLVISSVSSQPLLIPVSLKKDQTIDLGNILLQNNVTELQKVEITGRTDHSYKSDYSFFGNKTQTAIKDLPQAISTITKELIHDKMEFTLKDAVDEVAGVNQYSGYDEYTIRGFRAENARDINGLRGYNSTYTSAMLVNIERVEVIKGPTATLYGNCDPGGTINLVTKKPLDKESGSLDVYYGSYHHFRAMGDITGPLNKAKTLLYRMNAGYDNTGSFRDVQFGRSYQLAPSFSFVPNDRLRINLDFSLSSMHSVLDRGQPGLNGDPDLTATSMHLITSQPGDFLHELDIATVLSASYKITDRLSFSTGYLNYHTKQDVASHDFNSYITPDSINLSFTKFNYNTVTNTVSSYLTYAANTGHISHQLLAGYDFVQSEVSLGQQYLELPDQFGLHNGIVGTLSLVRPQYFRRPTDTYQVSDFNDDATGVEASIYHTSGVYVQDQMSYKRFKLLVSLREESYRGGDDDDENDSVSNLTEHVFLPRIGLVYALFPNISIYGTYNKGFDPFEASADAQTFDRPFKPLISQLYEVGAKANFLQNKLAATIAIYQLTVQNVAVNANDPANPTLSFQQGENRARGVEGEITGNLLPNLTAMVSYAYSEAKITKSKVPAQVGLIAENAPKNISGSWLKYTLNHGAAKGLGIAVGHSLVSERNTLDPDIKLPGYLLFNGGISYGYRKFAIALNVNNITNRTYWSGAYNNINKWPGAPRNVLINVGYRF